MASKVGSVVRIVGVAGGGVDNQGDVAFIDVNDATAKVVRIGIEHHRLPRLIASLEDLQAAVARERAKHGKDAGPKQVSARTVVSADVKIDRDLRTLLLELVQANGVALYVTVPADRIDAVVAKLQAGKDALRALPPKRRN